MIVPSVSDTRALVSAWPRNREGGCKLDDRMERSTASLAANKLIH